MAKNCPNCGISVEDDPKFCPACGTPFQTEPTDAAADEPSSFNEEKERIFVLREKKYGDTERYDAPEELQTTEKDTSLRNTLSLYFSIAAVVLSVTAVVLVIIFAVLPANQKSEAADTAETAIATVAPTQAPTDPPIVGSYELLKIEGTNTTLYTLILGNSTLELGADYSGTLKVNGGTIGSVTLHPGDMTAELLNTGCTYTFDGKTLTIDYRGMTLIYQKAEI